MSFPFLQPYAGLSNSLQTAQAGGAGGVGGWVELGRTTLGSSQDEIDVTSLPDKRYYMVLMDLHGASGNPEVRMNFNNDTGSNYASRGSQNGGADYTDINQTSMELNGSNNNDDRFAFSHIANFASKEKLMIAQHMSNNGAGAANAPNLRSETVHKWVNTSNSISSIRPFFLSGRTYGSGSECVVLGWDPADTHTSNFWEELASVTLGSDGDVLSSGTISAKKYLWVQAFIKNSGDTARFNTQVTFNNDTGSNYAMRRSIDGGSDSTSTNASNLFSSGVTGSNDDLWCMNLFIVNNASNEKLCIAHGFDTYIGSGAGNAPSQRYEAVGKWTNTSNQITEIDITNSDTSNYDSISELRVWGAD